MDTILQQKKYALEARIWPLGRSDEFGEPPLWQETVKRWVDEVMRPTSVSYLVGELMSSSLMFENDTTIAGDIARAVDESADWQGACNAVGWRECAELSELLEEGDKLTLTQLLNMVLVGVTMDVPDDDELRLYWVKHTPVWNGDSVEMHKEIVDWSVTTDTYAAHRAHEARAFLDNMGEAPFFTLEWALPGVSLVRFSDSQVIGELREAALDDLPDGKFFSMSQAVDLMPRLVTTWLRRDWLDEHHYVNLDSADWHSEKISWFAFAGVIGVTEADRKEEVSEWLLVSEVAAEHLSSLGELVVPLLGSSHSFWGRRQFGQMIHMDATVEQAMIRSGYLDRVPTLGALHEDRLSLPRMRFTLGGEEFPFVVYGFSEHRPDRELDSVLLSPKYRDQGYCVVWGAAYNSEEEGLVRPFRIQSVTPEGHPEPQFHEG